MRYVTFIAALAMSLGAWALEPSAAAASGKQSQSDIADPASLLNGEWVIVSAGKTNINLEDDMPYVIFSASDNRYYIYNGCNMVNGDYVAEGTALLLMNSLTTQKYCADVKFDSIINAALEDDQQINLRMETRGNETYLIVSNPDTATSLTLRRHNMEFLNGLWRVKRLGDEKIGGDELNIFFDVQSLKVHGNTGCNFFNGDMRIDHTDANSLNLSGMGVTRMDCPNADLELKYLVALEDVTSAVRLSANTVGLLNRAGKQLMILEKMDVEPNK